MSAAEDAEKSGGIGNIGGCRDHWGFVGNIGRCRKLFINIYKCVE
jgi:hypothetical protein